MSATGCTSFVNGAGPPLHISGGRIIAVGDELVSRVVDLNGDRLLPGLVNAHDHLQLNNFPRVKFRDRYAQAGEWIADMESMRSRHAGLVAAAQVPRNLRLRVGALKNLLAGVTTVAHHDPLYPELLAPDFPIRVLQRYGWSHSLGVAGTEAAIRSHRDTPGDVPWFIHAGEGVSESSAHEFAALEAAGCLTANTRLIHGVAFGDAQLRRIAELGAAVIWCPASNEFLFGQTLAPKLLIDAGRVALGSDSCLTGSRDLLEEIQVARLGGLVAAADLEPLVTKCAARLLGLHDRGTLDPGSLADLLILSGELPLASASRADVRCLLLGGRMLYGDADYSRQLMNPGDALQIEVDGRGKVLLASLARMLADVRVPGVRLSLKGRAA